MGMFAAPTYWNSTGQGGALSLPSGWDVGLHDAVIQQVPWSRIGECRAFKFRRVCFVYETRNQRGHNITTSPLVCLRSWFNILKDCMQCAP